MDRGTETDRERERERERKTERESARKDVSSIESPTSALWACPIVT
jgi:hypothetical protein